MKMQSFETIHDLYLKCISEFKDIDIGIEEDIIGIGNGIVCIDFVKPKDKIWYCNKDRQDSLLYTYTDNGDLVYKPAKLNRTILIQPTYDVVFDYLQIQFKHNLLTLATTSYDKYVSKLFPKNKMRYFTQTESRSYYNHLKQLFKPTGKRRF